MQIYENQRRGKRKPPIWWNRGLRWECQTDSGLAVVLLQEVDDAFDVEGDDGFLAFFGFQEGKVVGVVVEEVLGEDGSCVSMLEQLCKVCYYVKRLKTICF